MGLGSVAVRIRKRVWPELPWMEASSIVLGKPSAMGTAPMRRDSTRGPRQGSGARSRGRG